MGQPLQLDHRPDVPVEAGQGGVHVLVGDRPDRGGLPGVGPPPAEAGERPQCLVGGDRDQFLEGGPPERPLDPVQAAVDQRPGPPGIDHPLSDGGQRLRPELGRRGVGVQSPDRSDGQLDLVDLAGGLSVRVAVIPPGVIQVGRKHLSDGDALLVGPTLAEWIGLQFEL
jgi:hypothetical protein